MSNRAKMGGSEISLSMIDFTEGYSKQGIDKDGDDEVKTSMVMNND